MKDLGWFGENMLNQRHIISEEDIFHRCRLFSTEKEQLHILQIQENGTLTFEGAQSRIIAK